MKYNLQNINIKEWLHRTIFSVQENHELRKE